MRESAPKPDETLDFAATLLGKALILPVSRIAQQQQHLFNRITAISGTTQTVLRDR
ncbi:MAG: hypothetical protein ACI87L_002150, partial [Litorivivens sp.]